MVAQNDLREANMLSEESLAANIAQWEVKFDEREELVERVRYPSL